MFLLFYSIWGAGEESHGIPAERLAHNLWLREMDQASARAWFGMPVNADHGMRAFHGLVGYIYSWV